MYKRQALDVMRSLAEEPVSLASRMVTGPAPDTPEDGGAVATVVSTFSVPAGL